MPFPKARSHELESTALGRDLTSPELKLIVEPAEAEPVALDDEQMFGAE